ncbi:hypothetical protein E2C01_067016 [Portunus trituberculatus]|uniref:Uncharacterized protein n=1 Tax=Portunus trituberculatus TaxID=210409 RepID=A0A5B7HWD2_PORTR|nr:hypothetical protein [Portunus trituberculatus]
MRSMFQTALLQQCRSFTSSSASCLSFMSSLSLSIHLISAPLLPLLTEYLVPSNPFCLKAVVSNLG